MEDQSKKRYCFDTSAFTDSWRRYYKPNSFRVLWDRIGGLIEDGRVLVPDEVKKEIGAGNDELITWFKQYNSHVSPVTAEQIAIVSEIVNKYPLVSQYKKPRAYHADPFVVALGKTTSTIVVTYERRNSSNDHPAVPDLCKEYRVECCSLADFFENEGWEFDLK
ncbi:MAG: DUF4411 family protein [Candidatus Levybacteria bacterium]|nr:DUF4411 family protein [Candidatus Levybacteria bacterium]